MYKISIGIFMAILMALGGIASAQPTGIAISDSLDNNSYIAPEEDAGSTDRYSRFDDSFDTNNFREPSEGEGTIHPETRATMRTKAAAPALRDWITQTPIRMPTLVR